MMLMRFVYHYQSVSLSHTNIASIFPLHLSKSFGGQYKWGSIQSITHTMVNLTVWCRRKKPTRMLIMTASFKRKLWMYYAFFPFFLSAVIGFSLVNFYFMILIITVSMCCITFLFRIRSVYLYFPDELYFISFFCCCWLSSVSGRVLKFENASVETKYI